MERRSGGGVFDSVVASLKAQKYEPKGARFKPPKCDTDMMQFHKRQGVRCPARHHALLHRWGRHVEPDAAEQLDVIQGPYVRLAHSIVVIVFRKLGNEGR